MNGYENVDYLVLNNTCFTSGSVSLMNSRISAAVPTKMSNNWDISSLVTPPPIGSSHFPTISRIRRIW